MSLLSCHLAKFRVIISRLGSLLLLFQRMPVVQMLFPEARLLSSAGLGEITTWTVATIAGLGAYDSVAGATTISQIAPTPVVNPVPATAGSALSVTIQVLGAPGNPGSWQVTVGSLPPGMTKTNSGSTCTISGVPTTSGNYPFTIKAWENSNNSGGSISKALTINVAALAPTITTDPASKTINKGGTATLTVAASGTMPGYQWYIGNPPSTATPVSGATSASYTTPTNLAATTTYWVRASNSAGSANSKAATVTVISPPVITQSPESIQINSGETATLTAAASGSSPSFQWFVGNPPNISSPVAGATSATFTTPPLTLTASYWVRASNAAGSSNSTAATVSVVNPPTITTQPLPVTVDTGNSAVLSVQASGTSPTFQWYEGESGNIATPVAGATSNTFTTPTLTTSTKFWVRASNPAGSVDSDAVTVSVNTPPVITTEPVSVAVNSGGSATLTVTASGTNPTFQWYVGNSGETSVPIPEATLASYTTPALTASNRYWVRVSNTLGTDDSLAATVTVQFAPVFTTPPQSISINSGSAATFSFVATGVSPTFQWYLGETGNVSQPIQDATGTTFTTATLTDSGSYWVRASSNFGDTDSATVTATVITPPVITAQPAASTVNSGQTVTFTVSASGTSPAFQWYIGTKGDTGTPVMDATSGTFTTAPLTGDTSFWVRASNAAGAVDSEAALVTVIIPPEITTTPASLTINPGATATLSVAATGTSPRYQWYEGLTGATDKPIDGATSATFTTAPLAMTTTFWARATNAAGTNDSPSAIVSVRVAPSITIQPASVTISKGKKAKLTVTATGTTPTYQWYKGGSGNTKSPIAGAKSSSFTTPALKVTTTYWVRISNPAGTVNSKTVTVNIKGTLPAKQLAKATGLTIGINGYHQWSQTQFSAGELLRAEISGPAADPDRDGITNENEYTFGFSPLIGDAAPAPGIAANGNQLALTFIAEEASGPGYHGLSRHYALETANAPDASKWSILTGCSDIIGSGQTVSHTTTATGQPQFYRLRIWLAP